MELPLLSPSSINDFIQCPAKFWYQLKYKSLPVKTEAMEFGTTLHNIIACYYELIPNDLTPDECFLYIRKAIEKVVGSQSIQSILKMFGWHLKQFEKFERERLSWSVSPKPIAVEKTFEKPPFKGIVDAMFSKGEDTIVVDWKSGYAPKSLPEYYAIQGCIYAALTGADEVIFYFLSSGSKVSVSSDDCKRAKVKIQEVIRQIKEGVSYKKRGEHCEFCPVQIVCYMDDTGIDPIEW